MTDVWDVYRAMCCGRRCSSRQVLGVQKGCSLSSHRNKTLGLGRPWRRTSGWRQEDYGKVFGSQEMKAGLGAGCVNPVKVNCWLGLGICWVVKTTLWGAPEPDKHSFCDRGKAWRIGRRITHIPDRGRWGQETPLQRGTRGDLKFSLKYCKVSIPSSSEGLFPSSGLETPWDLPGGAGNHYQLEGRLE